MVDAGCATEIVRQHIAPGLTVRNVRRLHGGMVNTVMEWTTDGDPPSVVAKLTVSPNYQEQFRQEFASLKWFREHTCFPVPKPQALIEQEPRLRGTVLLMEKLPGRNVGEAQLTKAGELHLQRALARIVADLHDHRRDTYGDAWTPRGPTRWLECDFFAPRMRREFARVRDRLSADAQINIARLLDKLDHWLPEAKSPTLVHGDLWATNILVDDTDPDRPRITGLVDGLARFADVEFELAYLRVFDTAWPVFFEEYTRRHPLRAGFEQRCRVYWLNTMLIHVRHFGSAYLPATERLAREIAVNR